MSVRGLIAGFNKKSSGDAAKKKDDAAADETPAGEILWHGWLSRAGTGILQAVWSKRYCVVHLPPEGPRLSLYEAMDMKKLKGGRLVLAGATVSTADDKIQLTTTDTTTPVNVRLKASSAKDATACVESIKVAISGKAVLPMPQSTRTLSVGSTKAPSAAGSATEAAADAPAPTEKLPTEAATPAAPPPAAPTPPAAPATPAAPAPPPAIAAPAPPPAIAAFAPPPAIAAAPLPPPAAPLPMTAAAAVQGGVAGLPPSTPIHPQLAAVAARLGAASGAGVLPAEAASPPASPEELASRLEALVGFVEQCADGVALQKLDGLTSRLERSAGLPTLGVANGSAASIPQGQAMAAKLAQLEALTTRIEAAVAA